MISVEVLRRVALFGGLEEAFLKEVAMAAQEETLPNRQVVYAAGDPAPSLFILVDGSVEQYLVISDPDGGGKKDFYLGDVDPGETFGLSAVIAPFVHTTTARALGRARVIRIDAAVLRRLCEERLPDGYIFMSGVAAAAVVRLHDTRVQLAATRMG